MESAAVESIQDKLDVELQACIDFLQNNTTKEQIGSEIQQLLEKKDIEAVGLSLIDALLLAFNEQQPEKENDQSFKDSLEGCVQVTLSIIRTQDVDRNKLLLLLAEGLRKNNQFGPLRLRTVTQMYNSIPEKEGSERLELFIIAIEIASKAEMLYALLPALMKAEFYLDWWSSTKKNRRRFYKAATEAFESSNMEMHSFEFLVKFLETYNGEEEECLAAMESLAVKACMQAITLPRLYRFDELLDLDVIQRLKQTQQHALLFELLEIFVAGKVDSFVEFAKQNENYISGAGFEYTTCMDKMRLLSLASLGVEQPEIPYSLAAKTLLVEEEDLEYWVIHAVRSGLVEAKIDQMGRLIRVIRSSQRVFTRDQWLPLQKRLEDWKLNIHELLQTVQQVRSQHVQ
eukprot:jgi/Galph1/2118/GphlegSOOS_G809.1